MSVVMKKRSLLELLTKQTLVKLATHYELPVRANASTTALVEALVAKRSIKLDGILPQLKLPELKDACLFIEQSPKGSKQELIDRLQAPASTKPTLKKSTAVNKPAKASKRRGQINKLNKETNMTKATNDKESKQAVTEETSTAQLGARLDLETLESWLWESANIMRGSIDSSDFKNFIFGLLFLKRFNDVFEERIALSMAEEGFCREDAEEEEEGNLFVPLKARWAAICAKTEDIGEAIDEAFASIEEQNPYLEKVLTAIQFGDKDKISNDLLSRLLRHFNKYNLDNAHLTSRDMLGDAYEYLIKMFADDAGKKGGEFYTPKEVVQLLVRILDPQPGQSVYDPTCGSGGMLVETAHHVSQMKNGKLIGGVPNVTLNGQEKNLGTWAIAKLNLYLHNITDAKILRGDTLTNPKHVDGNADAKALQTFDRVIANPPFSAKGWWTPVEINRPKRLDKKGNEEDVPPSYKKEVKDPFGRLQYGIPPRGYGDFAFLQHMLTTLKDNGRMGVILPHGVLFRGGEEGKIREGLLSAEGTADKPGDRIEGIIGLPSALFYNTGIPACMIIINKQKPAALKNKVIILDASDDYKEGKNQNSLQPEHIEKIASTYEWAFKKQLQGNAPIDLGSDTDKYVRIVETSDIKKNEYNLNITRYIDKSEAEVEVDLAIVINELAKLEAQERIIDNDLNGYLKELGLQPLITKEG